MRRRLALLLAAALAFSVAVSADAPAGAPAPLSFLVASDTHFGVPGIEQRNRTMVDQMNRLPGTPYPPAIGGRVVTPRGLLILGDLTDYATAAQFRDFETMYGLHGGDGLLRWPVYETIGNHDWVWDSPATAGVTRRHGDVRYAWDWDDVRMISLGVYPNAEGRAFLAEELTRVGRERRVILFFHYAMLGPWSGDWSAAEKDAFASTIGGYNVTAIFHGHFHRGGHYVWNGVPVFRPGSPKHAAHTFLSVRLERERIAVGTWSFDDETWRPPDEQYVVALAR